MQAWYAVNPLQPCTLVDVWQGVLGRRYVARMSIHRKNILAQVCVGYVLRIYTFRDMLKIGGHVRLSLLQWRELRHALLADFRTVLGIKLMLLRCHTKLLLHRPLRLSMEIKNAGLLRNDRALFRHLPDMHLDKLLTLHLQALPPEINILPTVQQVVEDCGRLLGDKTISDWIGKFVNRKMQFIFRSQNYEAQDIIAELNMKAISTFFFLTPFLEDLHRRNTVKRAVHNYGILRMQQYNKDNPRLWFNGREWENLIKTFSDNDDISNEQLSTANIGIGLDQFAQTEHRLAIGSYLRRRSELHRLIVRLLSMEHDPGFQKYLQRKTGGETTDSELAFNKYGRAWYFTHVAKYLHIRPAVVWNIVDDMQKMLSN
jgi:hypothetical protein